MFAGHETIPDWARELKNEVMMIKASISGQESYEEDSDEENPEQECYQTTSTGRKASKMPYIRRLRIRAIMSAENVDILLPIVIRKSVHIVGVTGMTTHNVLANGELRRNYDYMDRYKCSTEDYKILLFL